MSPPPVPGTHRAKDMTRPGITSPVLVSGPHTVAMASLLTTPRFHWEMFPHNRKVPEELFQELCGILLHAGIGMSGSASDVA